MHKNSIINHLILFENKIECSKTLIKDITRADLAEIHLDLEFLFALVGFLFFMMNRPVIYMKTSSIRILLETKFSNISF